MIHAQATRARRLASAGLFLFAAAGAALFGAVPAAEAQSRNWINPDVMALREEVDLLRQEVARLSGGELPSGGGASGGFSGGPISGDAGVRLDRIESELRRLIGKVEQLEYEQRQMKTASESLEGELRFRLDALERGEVADLSQLPTAQPAQPYNPAGGAFASGTGDAVAYGGVSEGRAGGYPSEAGGQAALGGGVLGTIDGTGGASAGGPLVDTPRYEGAGVARQPSGGGAAPAAGAGAAAGGPGADALYSAALESLRAGAFDVAEQQFSSFIQANPSDPRVGDATYWLGETYYVRGQYDLAARQFLNGFRNHPDAGKSPDSLLKLGMTLSQLNQKSEACATLDQVPVKYPDASPTVHRRADLEARRAGCR